MSKTHTKLLSTAACVLAFGAATPTLADDEILIGLAIAESGFMAAYDGDGTQSVKLWIDDQNAKGGLLGRQLKWIAADTKSDRAQGARAGQQMVDAGVDLMVVSCDYDQGVPAAAAAQRAGIPSVFLCAMDPKAGVQGAGAFAFTSTIAAQVQGSAGAGWAHSKLDAKTYYSLLDTTTEFDKSVCAGFEWAASEVGMTSIGTDTFKNDDLTIQGQITRILALPEKPDVLALCSWVPGGASAVMQIRAAGLDMPIVATSSFDGTYWVDAVPDLSNLYVPVQASVHGDDPRPDVNAYIERYKAKFGAPPATMYGVPIYPFMDLWAQAVIEAGTTEAEKIVPVLEALKDAPTIVGPMSFSAEWHIQTDAEIVILGFEDRKFKAVDVYRFGKPIPTNVMFRTK
ncbi:ABC transporter substrate-binding protein [Gemmobacter sp.]|uniref:ABC transporter substrate-binding protein n=1 Tax=Gemmobacter sp. TaxID=1898957 RepID=UPI002AFF31C8|nr:ABC transporter substrate-binding protein [Gemmobacter sp.]